MSSAPDVADIDASAFEDLPSTDVEVHTHVHFGMTGSFPLRLAELFFADDGLYTAEYAYITPIFGLGFKKHHREARGMAAIYEIHGLDEVLLQADRVVWHSYDNVDRVVLYDGGRFGRAKIVVSPGEGGSHAYRIHGEADPADLGARLQACNEEHGFALECRTGAGFSPREVLRRFLERG